jgi:hypothetical protein
MPPKNSPNPLAGKLIRFATTDGGWLYVDPVTNQVVRAVPGNRRAPNVDALFDRRADAGVDDEGEEEDQRQYYERSVETPAGLAALAPGAQLVNPIQSSVVVGLVRVELVMTQALDTSLGLLYVDRSNIGEMDSPLKGLDTVTAVGASVTTPTSQALVDTAWVTPPTLGDNWVRRQRMSILGETTVWTWDPEGSNGPPLIIPPGGSVVIAEWDNAATGTFLVNWRWQEVRFGAKNSSR